MKKAIRNIGILLLPFLLMVIVNESVRPTIKEKPYSRKGFTSAMNPLSKSKKKCSWICHNKTSFCQEYHSHHLKPYFKITNLFYYGFIRLLSIGGVYGLVNLLLFLVLSPLFVWYCIIKSLDTDFCINLANLLGISYYEVNFYIFCVLYPLLMFGAFSLFAIQKIRLKRLEK